MRYRYQGKENVLSIGKYPTVTLADARQKREDAKKQLADGVDPSAQRKLDKIAAETAARQTFGLVADEYIENMRSNDAAASTINETTWLLKDLAAPLAKRPINDLHPAEILDLLKRIEKSGRRDRGMTPSTAMVQQTPSLANPVMIRFRAGMVMTSFPAARTTTPSSVATALTPSMATVRTMKSTAGTVATSSSVMPVTT